MNYKDITSYIDEKSQEGLTKIDISLVNEGYFSVIKTKETYTVYDEEEADKLIDDKRTFEGFAGVDKKFKAGKRNKSGEEVSPDTWVVVVKINHSL